MFDMKPMAKTATILLPETQPVVNPTENFSIEVYDDKKNEKEGFKYNYVIENAWSIRLTHLYAYRSYLRFQRVFAD
jgi:hypothetical protein